MNIAAGTLIRDHLGRILLVEPAYRATWEIPGGAGEEGESARQTCRREVWEELGLERAPCRLLCVDYAKPPLVRWEGLRFVFDGGVLGDEDIAAIRFPPDELASFEFVPLQSIPELVSPVLARRLRRATDALEHGTEPVCFGPVSR